MYMQAEMISEGTLNLVIYCEFHLWLTLIKRDGKFNAWIRDISKMLQEMDLIGFCLAWILSPQN